MTIGQVRHVFVTGGTGAVGSAVVRQLAAEGADVTFTYRKNMDAATRMTRSAGPGQNITAVQLDPSDAAATKSAVDEAVAARGGVNAFIHAAGPHVEQKYLAQVSPAEFAGQMQGETISFFNLLQPMIPHLRVSRGSVVAITTVALRRFPLKDGLSPSTKAGIEALTRVIAAEEGRYGVRANCVGPGILEDGMAARLLQEGTFDEASQAAALRSVPLRRFGNAEDVAPLAIFLTTPAASYITGQSIDVDGGYGI